MTGPRPSKRSASKMSIRVEMRVPDSYKNRAAHVFRAFSLIWGIPLKVVPAGTGEAVDIAYGNDFSAERQRPLRVPFDAAGYEETTPFESALQDGHVLWKKRGENSQRFDMIASAYRLMQMLDESQIAPETRDCRGTFPNSAFPSCAGSSRCRAHGGASRRRAFWKCCGGPAATSGLAAFPSGRAARPMRFALRTTPTRSALPLHKRWRSI